MVAPILNNLLNAGTAVASGNWLGAVGNVGNALGGLLSGAAHPTGSGAFAGLHSPYLENLDDARYNQEDAALMVKIAKYNNISVEEAAAVMYADLMDPVHSTHDVKGVWDAYAYNGGAGAGANLASWIPKFNAGHTARIVAGTLGPQSILLGQLSVVANYGGTPTIVVLKAVDDTQTPGTATPAVLPAVITQPVPVPTSATSAVLPAVITQPVPVPTSASSLTGGDLKDAGKAAASGAYDAALKVLMKTPEGKAAQNAGAKQWLSDNAVYFAAAAVPLAVGLTLLIGKASKK